MTKPWEKYGAQPTAIREEVAVESHPAEKYGAPKGVFASEAERRNSIESLPELSGILQGKDRAKSALTGAAMMTTLDPYEMGKILSTQFPEIGVTQTPEGEFIAVNNDTGQAVILNKPGLSQVDVLQALGIMTAFYPSSAMALNTGKAVAPALSSLKQAMTGSAINSGVTQGAIEAGQTAAGGNASPEEIALSTATGPVGELISPAIAGAKSLIRGADESLPEREVAQEAIEKIKTITGEEPIIFPAQKASDINLLQKQEFLMQQPETSKKALEALKKQNDQAYRATSSIIDTIASPAALETGLNKFYNASKKSILSAKAKVNAETKPLYDKAFKANPDITQAKQQVINTIDNIILDLPDGGLKKKLTQMKTNLDSAKTLKQLQRFKMTELDDVLDKSVTNNASNSLKTAAAQVKDSLTQSLELISPDYLAANQLYSSLTKEMVGPLKSSVIGKISKLSDDKIDNITNIIFDPKQTNPSIIKNAKQVISDIDPSAWDEILRVQLQKRIGGLFDALEDVEIPNSPSALKKALYGNNEQRKVLLSGMNTTQRANFVALEDMLTRQSRGRKIGSPTDSNQSIRKWLSSSVLTRAADKITTPYSSVKSAAQDTNFSKNAKNLAKIMFDPDFAGDFQRLQGQAKTPATIAAFIQFLTDSSRFLNRQEREEQQQKEQQG